MGRVKIISVFLVLFITLSSAVKMTKIATKASSLEVKGYVFDKDEKVDGALVKLYQNNRVVKMTKTKKSKFQFVLFSGMRYMIEIIRPGSITERIQISTEEKTQFGGKYLYEFKVDLINEKKFEGVDVSDLDFPTAIIRYDKSKGEYAHDGVYGKRVKEDLKRLRLEAQSQK